MVECSLSFALSFMGAVPEVELTKKTEGLLQLRIIHIQCLGCPVSVFQIYFKGLDKVYFF